MFGQINKLEGRFLIFFWYLQYEFYKFINDL